VGRYQKCKTNLDFTEARDSEWQWHQLGSMQVCTSLHTDNHASTSPLSFLKAGCPSCCPTNSVKALKAKRSYEAVDKNSPATERRAAASASAASCLMLCQGVPVRIELGPRDVSNGVMVMARRDTGAKITVKLSDAIESLKSLLEDIHEALFSKYVTPFYRLLAEPA